MVDMDVIKNFVIQAVELGYDVHDVILRAHSIVNEDDMSNILKDLRLKNEIRTCYYATISIDNVVSIIEDANGKCKKDLLNSMERRLKNID